MKSQHLENVCAELGAALMQSIPSDDQIIIGHIRKAYEAAKKAQIVVEGRDHHHAAGTMIGLDIDTCAICGKDIRNDIHIRGK